MSFPLPSFRALLIAAALFTGVERASAQSAGPITSFCFCNTTAPAPCGNFYPPGGCWNSIGAGAIMTAAGTTSVSADDLVLTTVQMPPNRPGLLIMAPNSVPPAPFYDGVRCFTGPAYRLQPQSTGPSGQWNNGPGLSAYTIANLPPPAWIVSGSTFTFQSWFRDPLGPCGTNGNTSNAIMASFVP